MQQPQPALVATVNIKFGVESLSQLDPSQARAVLEGVALLVSASVRDTQKSLPPTH